MIARSISNRVSSLKIDKTQEQYYYVKTGHAKKVNLPNRCILCKMQELE